jgi:antitoxin component HigA of HigAB toxin-antitoxin module
VNFCEQQRRLIAHLRALVRSGDATERGLARLTGVSQPHMHNVLKGKRLLSLEMADQVLAQLHLDLLDFIEPGELLEWQRRR